MKTYEVLREHDGDRSYREGDRREAEPASVEHLVTLHVLREVPSEPVAVPEPLPASRRKRVSSKTMLEVSEAGSENGPA